MNGLLLVFRLVFYFSCALLVTVVMTFALVKAARNKYAMITIGIVLFAIGFFTYFSPVKSRCNTKDRSSNVVAVNTNGCLCLQEQLGTKAVREASSNECVFVVNSALALSSVNRTLSAFYPSRGDYDDTPPPGWTGLRYWLFHLAAILYIFALAVSYFGIELMNVASLWLYKLTRKKWLRFLVRQSELNVFWEAGQESEALAEQMPIKDVAFAISTGGRSWRKLQEDDAICKLVRKGVLWISSDSKTNRKLLTSARRHFFISSDCHENVVKAQAHVQLLYEANIRHEVDVYVRVWADADDDAVYGWADKWNGRLTREGFHTQINVLREEAIVSRRFLIDHPMLDCPNVRVEDPERASVAGEFRVLVVGFGLQGERLMGDMICDAQFPNGKGGRVPISVDVVDKDDTAFGWWKANCEVARTRYGINFENCVAGSEVFWKLLASRSVYNRIVISTQDDIVNLRLANDIANYYAKRHRMDYATLRDTIFARVRRPLLSKVLCGGETDRYQLFGDVLDTYSPKWLLNDLWDNGAKFINGVWNAAYDDDFRKLPKGTDEIRWYQDNRDREERYWALRPMFEKESSRASFLHMRNILRLIGYECRLDKPTDENAKKVWREIPESQKGELKRVAGNAMCRERLAESEHLRWMAFHFVRGWEKWSPTVDEIEKLSNGGADGVEPNSMKKRAHIHANLEDFANLDAIDEKFNAVNRKNGKDLVNSRNKDRNIVYGIEAVYAAGLRVFKDEGVRDDAMKRPDRGIAKT